ncbi:uncharacterized protein LOC110931405 [Helianthus annuus]|uniref:uncharacterized protein LOC110931405 n=1 Tax=Helianthus annuus TaxID=4232 RepID=UPI000B901A85|nr:uncharacterized protein LOC110931405 [Helianthus annuus]
MPWIQKSPQSLVYEWIVTKFTFHQRCDFNRSKLYILRILFLPKSAYLIQTQNICAFSVFQKKPISFKFQIHDFPAPYFLFPFSQETLNLFLFVYIFKFNNASPFHLSFFPVFSSHFLSESSLFCLSAMVFYRSVSLLSKLRNRVRKTVDQWASSRLAHTMEIV